MSSVKYFSLIEMYNNSKGKTSISLVSSSILIMTGCFLGIKGSFGHHGETMIQGLAFATLGASLLGIRRFTQDKDVQDDEHSPNKIS
jgi:hypothetical protein